ncbi:hypothetical protein ACFW2Y_12290 [Streptomyces sp. NPDC058877]|uniref:hypothetical protein n=1 Tax=unclassified Streptomyces TaxID=2593676 RepID=UPI0036812A26
MTPHPPEPTADAPRERPGPCSSPGPGDEQGAQDHGTDTAHPHRGGRTNGAAPVSYREMAEAAVSQAAYRGLEEPTLRPEADVRRVAWWRVRGLHRSLHTLPYLGVLAMSAFAVDTVLRYPDNAPFWIVFLPVVTLVWTGIFLAAARRTRRMARVARQEPGRTVRYLLLHSYTSEAPWLVFFPLDGGDDAEPIGTLPLQYGPIRHRFRDLPGPVGEAALCGDATYRSVTVPWIGDRVAWPSAGYGEIDLDGAHDMRFVRELIRPE